VPLTATDALPVPRTVLEYTMPTVMPVVEPPPVRRAARSQTSSPAPSATAAPVVPPDAIGREAGIIVDPGPVDTDTIEAFLGSGVGTVVAAAPPPPAPPAPAQPLLSGVEVKPPARTKYVAPVYPDIARRNGIQGVVIVEAIVSVDGRIRNARVLRSHPFLDEAALQAVRSWEYSPTLLNGRPTPVIMTVTVNFTLR
jgi:protein TonB